MINNAAATIIQRSFRRYLNKKHDADLLNVVKAAEEFNFDSLLEATIGDDMEGMDTNFDENLEMSTGDKKTTDLADEFDQEVGDDEPNYNDSAKFECIEDDDLMQSSTKSRANDDDDDDMTMWHVGDKTPGKTCPASSTNEVKVPPSDSREGRGKGRNVHDNGG